VLASFILKLPIQNANSPKEPNEWNSERFNGFIVAEKNRAGDCVDVGFFGADFIADFIASLHLRATFLIALSCSAVMS